jgi:hypothetical protein
MKPWKELRLDIASYIAEVRHGALSYEQQTRLSMAWPTVYLSGNASGCGEDVWRGALGYTATEWESARERFALVLDKDGVWMLCFLRDEIARQREQSKKQSERVSKRWNTTVSQRIPNDTSEYPAVALESKKESSLLYLEANGGERWVPSAKQVKDWQVAHPGVDFDAEFARMRGWLEANPERRKTLRGLPRFANFWLSRAESKTPLTRVHSEIGSVWSLNPKRGG